MVYEQNYISQIAQKIHLRNKENFMFLRWTNRDQTSGAGRPVGLVHLAANFPAGHVSGSSIRWIDPIIGMYVHVCAAAFKEVEQGAQRHSSQCAGQVGGCDHTAGKNTVERPAARRTREERHHNRPVDARSASMDMRCNRIVDIKGYQSEVDRLAVFTDFENNFSHCLCIHGGYFIGASKFGREGFGPFCSKCGHRHCQYQQNHNDKGTDRTWLEHNPLLWLVKNG